MFETETETETKIEPEEVVEIIMVEPVSGTILEQVVESKKECKKEVCKEAESLLEPKPVEEVIPKVIVQSVQRLYDNLFMIIGTDKVTSVNMIKVIISLMQTVETYDNLKGVQKKEVIISVLNKYLDEKVLNETYDSKYLRLFINMTLPILIDSMISIEDGDLVIKTKSFFANMCGCIFKNKKIKKQKK
jgi:hypothetical protein